MTDAVPAEARRRPRPTRPASPRTGTAGRSQAASADPDAAVARTTPVVPPDPHLQRVRARLLDWYAANRRDLPWRRTTDPYAILVSEVMLQQTQVARVVPKYAEFAARFPDLKALAGAATAEVLAAWSGLGYNGRAVRLQRCARTVVEAAGAGPAALPTTLDGLMRLPGIGPYTARAVLVFAHNADLAAVDANVRRVLTHALELPHDLPAAHLQAIADAALPRGWSRDWHNALMDYGALVLTSRVTGIAPLTRQTPFAGSRRWYRAGALRLLLARAPRTRAELARLLDIPPGDLAPILQSLAGDGLVTLHDDEVTLP